MGGNNANLFNVISSSLESVAFGQMIPLDFIKDSSSSIVVEKRYMIHEVFFV